MLLLHLLVGTGQRPDAGLTQADKTCTQLNFYLEIFKGGHLDFKGGQKPPLPLPLNETLITYEGLSLIQLRRYTTTGQIIFLEVC